MVHESQGAAGLGDAAAFPILNSLKSCAHANAPVLSVGMEQPGLASDLSSHQSLILPAVDSD